MENKTIYKSYIDIQCRSKGNISGGHASAGGANC